ncbi:autotransporter assembly complex protein TamA [Vulcaniibacterium gelatinicum]|uniref:autotransporter assembly complex protein TamA n=1 Tax=Vulcaniibacterium gelatinicum TaxID=2598725 RepID=UPI0011CB45B6
MPSLPRLLSAFALALAAAAPAAAQTLARVEIVGLDEAMARNVREALSLDDALGRTLPPQRLEYLLREAEAETRTALEPFGYYTPEIRIEHSAGDPVTVTIAVTPGRPVVVRQARITIAGEGARDPELEAALAAFRPRPGEPFEHARYEASKAAVLRTFARRGYFDADFVQRRVEVTRAAHAADIFLAWDSGPRHALGAVRFVQQPRILRDDLLERLVRWTPGTPYDEARVDALRESLQRLDYFSAIEIAPQPAQASSGHVLPVEVALVPAPRSIYSAGLSYGTDLGTGVRLGLERRYVNDRGHKALAQLDYAERRQALILQYRVPAFAWVDGWYSGSLQYADEQTEFTDARRLELVASRSGQINRRLSAAVSLHLLRERWRLARQRTTLPLDPDRYASFVYPSLRAEYIAVDDRLAPRAGFGASALLRGGLQAAGSDANFLQLHATGSWFRGLDPRSRLIARGEVGLTWTGELVDMPPSLRFFAGGDRSIRGYAWREVGPRLFDLALGARNVITASLEYERYFDDRWGAAVFVDRGSAFDDRPDWHTGVGIGLRWRSPVGPVRVDVAHGLDAPDAAFQLHLNIGADL